VAAALLAMLTTVGAGLLLQGHRGSASVDARALLRQMPLSFEANAGQAGADVRFIARAPGYALALTADGSRLTLGAPGHAPATLTTRFVGAQRATVGGTRPRHGRRPARPVDDRCPHLRGRVIHLGLARRRRRLPRHTRAA